MGSRPSGAVAHPAAVAVAVQLLMEVETLEHELRRGGEQTRALDGPDEPRDRFAQAGDPPEALLILVGPHAVGDLDAPPGLEVLDDALAALECEVLVPDLEDGA